DKLDLHSFPTRRSSDLLSLTIDGIHTVLSSTKDCKTCTYFVPEDATVVDGKKIGIKPGEAICLKAGVLYGNLSIINLEGEEDKRSEEHTSELQSRENIV